MWFVSFAVAKRNFSSKNHNFSDPQFTRVRCKSFFKCEHAIKHKKLSDVFVGSLNRTQKKDQNRVFAVESWLLGPLSSWRKALKKLICWCFGISCFSIIHSDFGGETRKRKSIFVKKNLFLVKSHCFTFQHFLITFNLMQGNFTTEARNDLWPEIPFEIALQVCFICLLKLVLENFLLRHKHCSRTSDENILENVIFVMSRINSNVSKTTGRR